MNEDFLDFYPVTTAGKPPRLCCKYVRTAILPKTHTPGPMSAWPFSWVLAQANRSSSRQIWFVRLDLLFQDGLFEPYSHRPFRDSTVVCGDLFRPRAKWRQASLSLEDITYFRHWAGHYRRLWEDRMLSGTRVLKQLEDTQAYCRTYWRVWTRKLSIPDVLRVRCERGINWLLNRHESSMTVMFRSEHEVCWWIEPCGWRPSIRTYPPGTPYSYVRQGIAHPTVLNQISHDSFGDHREVVGFVAVLPHEQSLAGIPNTQRIFYLSHANRNPNFCDGIHVPDNYADCVRIGSIHPGVVAESFAPAHVSLADPSAVSSGNKRKNDWLARHQ